MALLFALPRKHCRFCSQNREQLMEDQIRNRIKKLEAQRDQIFGQINKNTTQRQQLEAA